MVSKNVSAESEEKFISQKKNSLSGWRGTIMPNNNHQNKKLEITKFGRQVITSQEPLINKEQVTKMRVKSDHFIGNKKAKIPIADFKLTKDNQEIIFRLRGKKAKALKCLIECEDDGCSALEISKTFALRLSEYIRALRHDNLAGGHNLNIVTRKENYSGGWFGKYILCDQVAVFSYFFGARTGGRV